MPRETVHRSDEESKNELGQSGFCSGRSCRIDDVLEYADPEWATYYPRPYDGDAPNTWSRRRY